MLQNEKLLAAGLAEQQAAQICRAYNGIAKNTNSRSPGDAMNEFLSRLSKPWLSGLDDRSFSSPASFSSFSSPCDSSRQVLWLQWTEPSASVVSIRLERVIAERREIHEILERGLASSGLSMGDLRQSRQQESERTADAEGIEHWQREFDRLRYLACHDPEFYWRHVIEFMQLTFAIYPEQCSKVSVQSDWQQGSQLCSMVRPATEEDGVVWFAGCKMNVADMALEKMRETEKAIIWANVGRMDFSDQESIEAAVAVGSSLCRAVL